MKRVLVFLLALALLCVSVSALAEGEAITLELNTSKLPVYAADDPSLSGLKAGGDGLPVLVLLMKKSQKLQVNVQPKTVKNKKVDLTVDNGQVVQVKGNSVQGVAPGEAVLTIASQADPTVTLQYRIVVIQPVTRVNVTAPEKSVAVGGTMQLAATILPENATKQQVTWESANPDIATVDENGVVTGIKRGGARITATATDGSKIRANINVQVNQTATEIQLDKAEVTVDVGRTAVLKANVLPKDVNTKKVVWSSSDESIATVNAQGRITGVTLGECEIICTSAEVGDVQAKAMVHVQQPVKKVTFNEPPFVYNGETGQLTWNIEPANATNPALKFTSGNTKVLTVDENGVVTGVAGGTATVKAVTTDGSNRQAQVKVNVGQHVTGVHMRRKVAYIDPGQTQSTGAILEPQKAKNLNTHVTWESDNPAVASVAQDPKDKRKVDITGNSYGDATVTVTTEDGGFQSSLQVKVGDFEHSLSITAGRVEGADPYITVRNDSDLYITSITVEVTVYDIDGNVVPSNSKDPKKPFRMVYNKPLEPGASTRESNWKLVDFMLPDSLTVSQYVMKLTEFQIDNDWVKVIRPKNRPTKKCPVHI